MTKTYTGPALPSSDAARDAACSVAIGDHVEDLMRTLREMHAPRVEYDDAGSEEDKPVDWIAQLRRELGIGRLDLIGTHS